MNQPAVVEDETLALVANISTLFTEHPYPKRPAAAAAAGFASIETWWPFPTAVVDDAMIDRMVASIDDAGVALTALNLYGGDLAAGESGILSAPGRGGEFEMNLEAIATVAERTGCRSFNALYGRRIPGVAAEEQDRLAVARLCRAVRRVAQFGGTILIEALRGGGPRPYPLHTAADAARVVEEVRAATGLDNIAVLFDTFHLASNGEDLVEAATAIAPLIGHVQIADAPGRGEPGSGDLDIVAVVEALWHTGYRGRVSCEYLPVGTTNDSFEWLRHVPRLRALHEGFHFGS